MRGVLLAGGKLGIDCGKLWRAGLFCVLVVYTVRCSMVTYTGSGFKAVPKTPLQWLERWTKEMTMRVPTRSGGEATLELLNIAPVPQNSVWGDPDLLLTPKGRAPFYVLFQVGRVFESLDRPLLVYPPAEGCNRAFWVMPIQRARLLEVAKRAGVI